MESKSSYLFETVSLEYRQDIWNDIKKTIDAPKLDIIKVFETRILVSENS